MTIECYYTACPYHDNEGPFCYEDDCLATPDEIVIYDLTRRLELRGYNLDQLDRDNPHNQWIENK